MSENAPPPQDSPAQLLILSGSFFLIFLGPGALQQYLVPVMGSRAGLNDVAASTLFACVYLAGPAFLAVYGHVFQALRERWCVLLGGLTYTLFAAALLATDVHSGPVPRLLGLPALLLAAAILWGFGAETLWATGPSHVINAAPRSRYGTTSGVFQSATYCGQMLGVLLLGTILRHFADPATGQVAMLATAVAVSAGGNVVALLLRVKPTTRAPARLADAFVALRSRPARYLILLSVANSLGWGLLLSSFATLVKDIGQEARLHWIVLPYYAGRLLVAWLAGHTSDRVGRERVMLVGFACGTISLVAAAVHPTAPVIAVVSAVLGMQAAMVSVSSTAATGDYIPQGERHLVFAGTNAWGYLATGGTMIASQLLRRSFGGFAPPFLVFAAFYAACAVLVVRMRGDLRAHHPAPGA